MRSGLVTTDPVPVLAAGVGLRYRSAWLLRSVSFRADIRPQDGLVLGIATGQQATASAVVNLLAGLARPSHGELRVLGKDLTTAAGRGAVRRRVGIARIPGRPESVFRIRGLAEHAARLARIPDRDRAGRAAAILDRLALMPWAEVRLSAAPRAVAHRAELAAAAVHGPELLLLDGLLDGLAPRERASVAAGVRELARDTVIIVAGRDAATLRLTCDEVLTLSDGILAACPRRAAALSVAAPGQSYAGDDQDCQDGPDPHHHGAASRCSRFSPAEHPGSPGRCAATGPM